MSFIELIRPVILFPISRFCSHELFYICKNPNVNKSAHLRTKRSCQKALFRAGMYAVHPHTAHRRSSFIYHIFRHFCRTTSPNGFLFCANVINCGRDIEANSASLLGSQRSTSFPIGECPLCIIYELFLQKYTNRSIYFFTLMQKSSYLCRKGRCSFWTRLVR